MKVFTNGCFDILTVAHFKLLQRCRELAGPDGMVCVALDTDEKLKTDKGIYRPIFSLEERIEALKCLDIVDGFISFNTNDQLKKIIESIKPDIIVKGYDWAGNVVGSDVEGVKLIHIMEREVNNRSTSDIINKVIEKYKK